MIKDKEHRIGDICYLLYNNKLNKVIVTAEITVGTKSLDVQTKSDIIAIKDNPSFILRCIQNTLEDLYNVAIIPQNDDTIELTPIQGAFYGSSLYDSKEELLSDLAKSCP